MDAQQTFYASGRVLFVHKSMKLAFLAELNSFGAPKITVHAAMTLQKELLLIDRLSFLVPRREMFGVKADASVTG